MRGMKEVYSKKRASAQVTIFAPTPPILPSSIAYTVRSLRESSSTQKMSAACTAICARTGYRRSLPATAASWGGRRMSFPTGATAAKKNRI